MKQYYNKHKVKLETKQPDLIAYFQKILLGSIPIFIFYFLDMTFRSLAVLNITSIVIPEVFLNLAWLFFFLNIIGVWFISPISFSKVQRTKHLFKEIIENNNLYYESDLYEKITSSLEIVFYWESNNFYIEVYPQGDNTTSKMNDLAANFQTKFNMFVLSVQDDYPNHTTYILTKESSVAIDSSDFWS